jgi:hypothetical protein
MNSQLTCSLISGTATASKTKTQLITLKDNELKLRDCQAKDLTIHSVLEFTVYLDYEGTTSEDFSDVSFTITYNGLSKPYYVTET